MITPALVALVVLTSLGTGAASALVVMGFARRVLERRVAAAGDELAARISAAVREAADEVGPRLRAEVAAGLEEAAGALVPRVREEIGSGVRQAAVEATPGVRSSVEDGVRSAAEEVLPELRRHVREGVGEGLRSVLTSTDLGREVVRRSASVLDAGLGVLFGRSRDDDRE